MKIPISPPLKKGYRRNFQTLLDAAENNNISLVSCTDVKTGKPSAVICAVNGPNDGSLEFVPLAKLFDENPYEEVTPP